jgi:prepilin-type N-terminal cleavage/methylation domain-containing protein
MEKRGFTLIELLVVIAIIGLLATMAVVAFGDAQAKARDTRRLADITAIDKVVRLYVDENNAYPGDAVGTGQKISKNCTSFNIVSDLISSGYLPNVPTDPRDDGTCNFGDTNYFYGFDMDHAGGDACFSINQVETTWGEERLIEKFGQLKVTSSGGDADINTADFNYCYEAASYYP